MTQRNLLLVSDAISCSSGLGRITRDLATRIHAHIPEIRLATAGYGGMGSAKHQWTDYHFNVVDNWLPPELPQVVTDFAGADECAVMFVWDLSRLAWFADPAQCPNGMVQNWLKAANIQKWIYHPVDAEGPHGKLNTRLARIMKGFDRVLDYSAFSSRVTGNPDHLPHGIDTKVFFQHDRQEARQQLRAAGFRTLKYSSFMVGIVATNQTRKDWALGFETCRLLLDRGHDVQIWAHTDTLERFWSIPNLIDDFGLQNRVVVTQHHLTDEQMAWFYSNCNVFLSIGLGEGFGFGQYESLACGTPVVAGNYCGSEWLPPSMKVKPIGFRYDGPFNCKRPVYLPEEWADCAEEQKGLTASLPPELDWNGSTLWKKWEAWFREGIR